MKKIIEDIKKYLKVYVIVGLVSSAIGVTIFLLFYFLQHQGLVPAANGTAVAFAVLFGSGVLCWLGRFGAYDSMSYGFKQMAASLIAREANKYNDFAGYKANLAEKRKVSSHYYFVMMLISLLFLFAFIGIEIAIKMTYKF